MIPTFPPELRTAQYREEFMARGYYAGERDRLIERVVLYDERGEWFRTSGLLSIWTGPPWDEGPHVEGVYLGPVREAETKDLTAGDAFLMPERHDYHLVAGTHDLFLPVPRVEPVERMVERTLTEDAYLHVYEGARLPCLTSDGLWQETIDLEAMEPHREVATKLGVRVDEFLRKTEPYLTHKGLTQRGIAELLRDFDVTLTPRTPSEPVTPSTVRYRCAG